MAMSTSYRVEANLRADLYDQVNQLSLDYHDRTSTGQLMSHASADLHEIQMFAVVIPLNTAFLLIAVGAFGVLLTVHIPLAFAAMLAYPIITVLSTRFFRRLSPATARVQQDLADVAHVVEENIAGVRTVRSFGREDDEVRKLQAVAERTFDDSMEAARLRTIYTPLFSWLPAVSQLVILGFGGYLVLEGQLTAGEFVAFFQYLNMLIFPVQSLGELVPSGQRAMTSAARVWNVLRQRPTVARTPHAGPMPEGGGDLVFEDVQFAYLEGYPVLRDFNLRIPAGASVALVGPTGCGKTTVAKLLPRFYEVQSGQVLTCAATSAWSSRTRSSSPIRSATTSPTAASTPRRKRSSTLPSSLRPPSSSTSSRTATTRSSASRASRSPAVSVSGWPSPAPSSSARAC